jgi:replicative DNA helicase
VTARIPPHATDAERVVLGGLMVDADAWPKVAGLITEKDFYHHDHRQIFAAMRELIDADQPLDVITVSDAMERAGTLEGVGGLASLGRLANDVPTTRNIIAYARLVADRARLRHLITAATEAIDQAYDAEEPAEVAANLATRVEQIASTGSADKTLQAADILRAALDAAKAAREAEEKGGDIGVPIFLPMLKRTLLGWLPERVYVIAARPNVGKTPLALQAAAYAARRGFPAGVISLELSAEEIGQRLLSHVAPVSLSDLMRGRRLGPINDHGMGSWPLYVDCDTYSLAGIASRAAEWHRKHGLRLLIVDHIGLVEHPASSANERLGEVMRTLKKAARRLGLAVIAVSQLNREAEREKRRPVLADLRDSGSIEQDADVVLGLHVRADAEAEIRKPIEIGILKGRYSARGWMDPNRFELRGDIQTIVEIAADAGEFYRRARDGE